MKKILDKKYTPKEIEERIYKNWIDKGYFHAIPDKDKKPFTIVIPPPNITGQLHMGHALNNTLQDILVRMKRMQGYCTLWLPGTDHASIATEARIVAQMKEEGISKEDLGREGFLERAWQWKEQYGNIIVEQLKKLGSSCDWERERFTMDEGLSKAVTEVFIRLYEKGLIYRGERIINWCPVCLTSISDAEVEYDEKGGNLWHIKYPIEDSKEYITVATTRPETMLGDTAVAVNPDDKRYSHLIGKNVILPLMNRKIPVISDAYVQKEFGTGAVKITPCHDPNDFEMGFRHSLEFINVMDDSAVMNENAGSYKGMDRYEARKKIVSDLNQLELLVKIENHTHNVGECYRCNTTIEPRVSKQWFVNVKPLSEPAIESVKNGKVEFLPERFEKTYFSWMENIRDWCISRQLWWGHRIPAYYCTQCGEMMVSSETPKSCSKCQGELKQDNDTLDTWFSSALWPFSTLGWPDKTKDLEYFYPTNVLVTAYDIIFFWVARMIFSGIEHMNEEPFSHVVIHGLVRDDQGRKMSKSLGNGIDPLEIIENYGTDALRFALVIGTSLGNDIRLSQQKIESGRNFANKIWNATRFVLMNFDEEIDFNNISQERFSPADKWILSRINTLINEVTENLEKFEPGIALQKIYEFIWEEFCDWYIELVKPQLYDRENPTRLEVLYVLNYVLSQSMKLLHPFMPFVTEEIYASLQNSDESIMISKWPSYDPERSYKSEEESMNYIMNAIRSIRNLRAEMNVPNSRKAKAIFITDNEKTANILKESYRYFEKLAFTSEIEVMDGTNDAPEDSAAAVIENTQIYIPMSDLIDTEKEINRLNGKLLNIEAEINRAQSKLSNENFIKKAPEKLVSEEREKLAKYTAMYESINARLNKMKKM